MQSKTKNSESVNKGRSTEAPKHRSTEAAAQRRPSSNNPIIQQSNNPSGLALQHSTTPAPSYSLRKGLGCWELTFGGQHEILRHEQGLALVAYLLLNPAEEPIHPLDPATRIPA